MPELRADFRRLYHVRYDDVDPAEAVDLVRMLPQGSLYLAALDPHLGWRHEEHELADLCDGLSRLTHMLSDARTTEGAPLVERPGQREDAEAAVARSRRIRRRIEDTEWEAIEVG